jgi:DNA-binding NarL/FixJ family response regulator
LVIDDDDDVRQLLTVSLPSAGAGEVVGIAAGAAAGLALARELQPDAIVTDLVASLTVEDADGYVAALREAAPHASVVVFSGRHLARRSRLPVGIDAYVVKAGLKELTTTLRELAAR